jgi:hypothetical protein
MVSLDIVESDLKCSLKLEALATHQRKLLLYFFRAIKSDVYALRIYKGYIGRKGT